MDYIILTAFVLLVTLIWKRLFKTSPYKKKKATNPRESGWFGRGQAPKDLNSVTPESNETIQPFTINIKEEVLADLQMRLENTRIEEPMHESQFQYGFNANYMKVVVEYWKNKYNWREQEIHMNKYLQFTTEIEGLQIHFIRVTPKVTDEKVEVIPLMLLHGWPSNCMEFLKVSNLLTTPSPDRSFVFEVVCPSIPGYGFSEGPHKDGLDAKAVARIFIKLMNRIGHFTFYVHGGDWGSRIASNMARFFPERIMGLHITMCCFSLTKLDLLKYIFFCIFPILLPPDQRFIVRPFGKKLRLMIQESGYFYMNATKPDTLGCAMSDSPAGLAAYLLEKYCVATNRNYLHLPDGGLTKKFTLDELLNCVMITWVNNSFVSAARFYIQNVRDILNRNSERFPINVPSGVSVFPHEVLSYPRITLTNQMKKLIYYNVLPRGGHFIGLEEPEMLADEIWNFVFTVQSFSKNN